MMKDWDLSLHWGHLMTVGIPYGSLGPFEWKLPNGGLIAGMFVVMVELSSAEMEIPIAN